MALTCGFYNSVNDRKYDARDFGQLFDGIISNGIFMSIGTSFMVTASEGMDVLVGAGHAWFNQTWTHNDAPMVIPIPQSEIMLDRIDTIVLEVNTSLDVRDNTVKVIKGTPSSEPVKPALVNEGDVHQYPLCDVYVTAETESIIQANITNRVGTSDTPFVTGILDTISIDALIAQWEDEWTRYLRKALQDTAAWTEEQKKMLEDYQESFEGNMELWETTTKASFDNWFNNLQIQLSGDVAANLQLQLDAINEKDFERYYSLINKSTVIIKDAENVTQSIVETYDDAAATTTFSANQNGKIITTKLVPNEGLWDYIKTATITKDGNNMSIVEAYQRVVKNTEVVS